MTKEFQTLFRNMRQDLADIAEQEATKLYRLAWNMERHGCDPVNVAKCREEANQLHLTGYPERLITYFHNWDYAFKF